MEHASDEDEEEENEDDYYDEDEEDEEDEDRRKGSKRKKKKKKKGMSLIDIEAEEDDPEEEDEDDELGDSGIIDDDDVDDPGVNERDQMHAHQRLEQRRAMNDDDPEALARYISERYEAMDEDTGAPDTSGIDQQSLLPTIKDPRLFMVRCTKPGHERRAIFSLLQKKFNLLRRGIELGILAAVAPEHLKGRIYIEAYSSAQVQLAVGGLALFSTKNIKMVDQDEMPDVLKLGKRPEKQANGNWVRIKRKDSIYRGDLAQVCNVREDSNDGYVTIRLIPRLDLKSEKDLIEDKDDTYADEKDPGTRRKGRPPQKLFDRKELYRLTGSNDVVTQRSQETFEVFDVWNDNMYRFGLLYMPRVNVKSLITGDAVQPTVEELEMWIIAEKHMRMMFEEDPSTMDAEVAARGLELDISSVAGRKMTKLFKGDSVRVTNGEQKGLEGKIESINQDVVMVRIPEVPDPVQVNRAHITKTFKVGEHVKVSSGKKAGNTGAIVRVEGDFLTIFSDTTREEIKVLSSQVADSADVNTDVGSRPVSAARSLMRYELFDLVQMLADPNEKGVIIQVQNESLTLLTPQNTRRVVPIGAVRGKVRDESVRALDDRGNPIAPNDTIHVMSGPLQNRTGVVKHVAGNTVFFKARDEVNNCGLLAVVASSCTASTAAARRLTSTMSGNPTLGNPTPIPRGAGEMIGRGGGRGGQMKGRDPLLRKEVKVTKGQFKGYTGKVVDVYEKTIRVELTSKMKTITLTRDRVKEVNSDNNNSTFGGRSSFSQLRGSGGLSGLSNGNRLYSGQTPRRDNSYSNQTPRVTDRYGSQTPRFGSATPRLGLQTPSHYGSAFTPSRDDFRAIRTPRHSAYSNSESSFRPTPSTPAAEGNPYTPFMPHTPATPATSVVPQTPMSSGYGGVVEPRTPAGIIEPSTPAYGGMEPQTPAPGMEPTTPAPAMEPRTPAPGLEPRTPGPAMEPSTPMIQEPSTPHTPAPVPQTPHPQEEESVSDLGYKVLIDVEVLVNSMGSFSAKVTNAAHDGSLIQVKMLAGDNKGQEFEVPVSDITPVQPRPEVGEHPELVKVLDGPHAARTGRLQSVDQGFDDMEGLIKFLDGQVATLNMSLVAKCSEE